jgi:hypothetical protein
MYKEHFIQLNILLEASHHPCVIIEHSDRPFYVERCKVKPVGHFMVDACKLFILASLADQLHP